MKPVRLTHCAAALLLAATAACLGFRPHLASSDLAGPPEPDAAPVRVFLTGDTAGFLTPCGCETSQFGGYARRATYLKRASRPQDLRIDLGNLVLAESPVAETTLSAAIEGLAALGYQALVPGENEVKLGPVFEKAAQQHPKLHVICANLARADAKGEGRALFEPWLLHRTPDGRTVAVIGVVEPFGAVPQGYVVTPAETAVAAALSRLQGRADAVIVAGSLRDEATLELAARFPQVALVAGGYTSKGSKDLVSTAGAPALLLGEFGWYVARVDLDASLRPTEAMQAWLDPGVPDDPELAALALRTKAAMTQAGGDFAVNLVATFREQGFAGSASCAECHPAEFEVWKKSGHAHAMHTLVLKKSEKDPTCVACHLADVPASPTAPFRVTEMGFGCEGCHGAGSRHNEFARDGKTDAARRALAPATAAACLRCHVPPNVQHFDFATDWPKIAHGKKAQAR